MPIRINAEYEYDEGETKRGSQHIAETSFLSLTGSNDFNHQQATGYLLEQQRLRKEIPNRIKEIET